MSELVPLLALPVSAAMFIELIFTNERVERAGAVVS